MTLYELLKALDVDAIIDEYKSGELVRSRGREKELGARIGKLEEELAKANSIRTKQPEESGEWTINSWRDVAYFTSGFILTIVVGLALSILIVEGIPYIANRVRQDYASTGSNEAISYLQNNPEVNEQRNEIKNRYVRKKPVSLKKRKKLSAQKPIPPPSINTAPVKDFEAAPVEDTVSDAGSHYTHTTYKTNSTLDVCHNDKCVTTNIENKKSETNRVVIDCRNLYVTGECVVTSQ